MATQVSPGVVIKEREPSSATIVGALNIIGAFATTFKKVLLEKSPQFQQNVN